MHQRPSFRWSLWLLSGISLSCAAPLTAQDAPAPPAPTPAEREADNPAPPQPLPPEAKPEEVKPDEPKPDEAKPEAKPDEAKPDEAKPDAPKPDETKPAETPAAPEQVLAGHSIHGEVFNEGPRQAAVLLEGMGNVSFPATTKVEDAQKFINQGVAQLHGFWYFESERSFRQAAALDPDCAIAYWGMAMSNSGNEKRAKGFIAEATKRQESASDREQRYIKALHAYLNAEEGKRKERGEAYIDALEKLLTAYPDDLEAKAFLALQIWNNRNAGIKIQSMHGVNALIEQILQANPLHPVHHYRIHLWDFEKPEFALASSALCGQSVPGVAHMWHMPGHIYSRLKRYDDACFQQEASARVDHAHMMRYGVLPDQIHNFAHNNEWLIRNLIHVGRSRDALALAMNMIELPRHPKYNMVSRSGCSSSYGRARLLDVLETFEMWPQLLSLAETPYLDPTDIEREQIKRLRAMGTAHFELGHLEAGRVLLANLRTQLSERQAKSDQAVTEAEEKAKAENKEEKELNKAKEDAKRPFQDLLRELERAVAELEGREAAQAGDFTAAFEKLKKAGGVDAVQLALVQFRAGQKEEALKAAQRHVDGHKNEVQPLAGLAHLQWLAEQKEEAGKTLERLRAISQDIDLATPVFERLAPQIAELGWPSDWRQAQPDRADIGNRPELDSLGPFRWKTSDAASWVLVDAEGKPRALKEYQGRTVVVIFYLGYGCLHCAEQLKAFAPMAQQFADAEISLVAVSTDQQEDLKISLESYQEGQFPFPLVSDGDLSTFKAYRCFDDFEQAPLHGTFLLDGDGRVLWRDISYEPFMDAKFVLEEALRQRKLATCGSQP